MLGCYCSYEFKTDDGCSQVVVVKATEGHEMVDCGGRRGVDLR